MWKCRVHLTLILTNATSVNLIKTMKSGMLGVSRYSWPKPVFNVLLKVLNGKRTIYLGNTVHTLWYIISCAIHQIALELDGQRSKLYHVCVDVERLAAKFKAQGSKTSWRGRRARGQAPTDTALPLEKVIWIYTCLCRHSTEAVWTSIAN